MHALDRRRCRRGVLNMLESHRKRRLSGKRRLTRRQLVEHAASGVNIGAGIRRLTPRLLRGEVLGGTNDRGRLRHCRRRIRQGPGDAEVHHLHRAGVGDHDVRRLDIPVDDARLVAEVQRLQDLGHDGGCIREPHFAVLLDDVAQRFPLHALHHDIGHGAILRRGLAGVVYRHDRRVVQLRSVLSLAAEALQEVLIAGEVRPHHLDGDLAAEELIDGGINVRHATSANLGT